jgi:hypothetical protein
MQCRDGTYLSGTHRPMGVASKGRIVQETYSIPEKCRITLTYLLLTYVLVFKYCTYSLIFATLLFHFMLTFGHKCMYTNTTVLYPSAEILSSRARLYCSIPGNTYTRVQSLNF